MALCTSLNSFSRIRSSTKDDKIVHFNGKSISLENLKKKVSFSVNIHIGSCTISVGFVYDGGHAYGVLMNSCNGYLGGTQFFRTYSNGLPVIDKTTLTFDYTDVSEEDKKWFQSKSGESELVKATNIELPNYE